MRDEDTVGTAATDEGSFLGNNWPYILMLGLGLIGVALTSVAPVTMIVFWEVLVPVFAVITFFVRRDPSEPVATAIFRDVLHWGSVFIAMRLLMMPSVSQMLNLDGIALMLLTILALGTFHAGIQAWSWRLGVVGGFLGVSVPLFAWLERSSLLVSLVVIGAATVAALIWVKR